jgi:uncharacterized membrane protein HdeD (DUF308 family)
MKKFLNDFLSDPVTRALSTIIAGLLIIVFHSIALDIVALVLGSILVALGVVNIIKYFKSPLDMNLNLLTGLVAGAIGIGIIADPSALMGLIAVAFGIIVLYHGIVNLQNALLLKKLNYKFWYISLIFACSTILAGAILMILKDKLIDAIALVSGIILIVEGALNTWTAVKVKKTNGKI